MPEVVRGDRELAALADGRSRETIRDWRNSQIPHSICPEDGKTIIYIVSECVEWCSDRGIDFYDKEKKELTQLQQQKFRQELYKADELEHKARIRDREYSPVSEFEETQVILLQQVRQLMLEVFEDLKKAANLKGSEAEKLDAQLTAGFNKIADIDLSE